MKQYITQSEAYKFLHNLAHEPDAFKAFSSFVFGYNTAEHLLPGEAEAARQNFDAFVQGMNVSSAQSLVLSVLQNNQFNLQYEQIILLRSLMQGIHNSKLKILVLASLAHYCLESAANAAGVATFEKKSLQVTETWAAYDYACLIVIVSYIFVSRAFVYKCIAAGYHINSTTPLHRAAINNDMTKFRDLVRRGANLSAKTAANLLVRDLLNQNSELIAEFDLQNLSQGTDVGSERVHEQYIQRVARLILLQTSKVQVNFNYYRYKLKEAINNYSNHKDNADIFSGLQYALLSDDLETCEKLLTNFSAALATLTLQQQTTLFKAAKTIRAHAFLIAWGIDFREYFYKLNCETKVLKKEAMVSYNNQIRMEALCLLLPRVRSSQHIKEFANDEAKELFEKNYECSIMFDFPNFPVKIGMHRYDLQALMTAWGTSSKVFNPRTNLSCNLEHLYFDLHGFNALNAIYTDTTSPIDIRTLDNLIACAYNPTVLISQFTQQLTRMLVTQFQYITFDCFAPFFIYFLLNYIPLGETMLLIANSRLLMPYFAYHKFNDLIPSADDLFNRTILAKSIDLVWSVVIYLSFTTHSSSMLKEYENAKYQYISIREANNLNIDFLTPNMNKFDIVFAPDMSNFSLDFMKYGFGAQYLNPKHSRLFLFMLFVHTLNFVINYASDICFADYTSYDFKPVDPTEILRPNAKPLTFWKEVVDARNKPEELDVEPAFTRESLKSPSL